MNLTNLHTMRLAFDKYKTELTKELDPNRPELDGQPIEPTQGLPSQPARSGAQDTPLKLRHRKYFGARTNQPATDKVGFPDQAWSNVKSLSPASKKIRPYNVNSHH